MQQEVELQKDLSTLRFGSLRKIWAVSITNLHKEICIKAIEKNT